MAEKKRYGDSPWDNDPGDEPAFSEAEEFTVCRDIGMKPEQFANKEEGERFRKWLEKNPA